MDPNLDLYEEIQLACSLRSSQALQASAFVGRSVLIPGNWIQFDTNGISPVTVKIPQGAGEITAILSKESGKFINKVSLGLLSAGFVVYQWDGLNHHGVRMPPGKYFIKVNCLQEGKEVGLMTLIVANVNSVSLNEKGEGVRLNIADLGEVGLEQIAYLCE